MYFVAGEEFEELLLPQDLIGRIIAVGYFSLLVAYYLFSILFLLWQLLDRDALLLCGGRRRKRKKKKKISVSFLSLCLSVVVVAVVE